jgi:hypothetical protein
VVVPVEERAEKDTGEPTAWMLAESASAPAEMQELMIDRPGVLSVRYDENLWKFCWLFRRADVKVDEKSKIPEHLRAKPWSKMAKEPGSDKAAPARAAGKAAAGSASAKAPPARAGAGAAAGRSSAKGKKTVASRVALSSEQLQEANAIAVTLGYPAEGFTVKETIATIERAGRGMRIAMMVAHEVLTQSAGASSKAVRTVTQGARELMRKSAAHIKWLWEGFETAKEGGRLDQGILAAVVADMVRGARRTMRALAQVAKPDMVHVPLHARDLLGVAEGGGSIADDVEDIPWGELERALAPMLSDEAWRPVGDDDLEVHRALVSDTYLEALGESSADVFEFVEPAAPGALDFPVDKGVSYGVPEPKQVLERVKARKQELQRAAAGSSLGPAQGVQAPDAGGKTSTPDNPRGRSTRDRTKRGGPAVARAAAAAADAAADMADVDAEVRITQPLPKKRPADPASDASDSPRGPTRGRAGGSRKRVVNDDEDEMTDSEAELLPGSDVSEGSDSGDGSYTDGGSGVFKVGKGPQPPYSPQGSPSAWGDVSDAGLEASRLPAAGGSGDTATQPDQALAPQAGQAAEGMQASGPTSSASVATAAGGQAAGDTTGSGDGPL